MNTATERILRDAESLCAMADADFTREFQRLAILVEQFFAEEEIRMEQAGYPDLKNYREQHTLLLGALHGVASSVLAGNTATARELLQHLPAWFLFYESTCHELQRENPRRWSANRSFSRPVEQSNRRSCRGGKPALSTATATLSPETITVNSIPC